VIWEKFFEVSFSFLERPKTVRSSKAGVQCGGTRVRMSLSSNKLIIIDNILEEQPGNCLLWHHAARTSPIRTAAAARYL
jgi:hypothetical protein